MVGNRHDLSNIISVFEVAWVYAKMKNVCVHVSVHTHKCVPDLVLKCTAPPLP